MDSFVKYESILRKNPKALHVDINKKARQYRDTFFYSSVTAFDVFVVVLSYESYISVARKCRNSFFFLLTLLYHL